MVNIVVSRKRFVNVSSHGTGGVIDTSVPVTIKNVPTIMTGGGATTIDQLTDVNLAQRTDGATLVYDQPTNTYIVKELDFTEITGNLDGGTF
jgi:hypothetical protein